MSGLPQRVDPKGSRVEGTVPAAVPLPFSPAAGADGPKLNVGVPPPPNPPLPKPPAAGEENEKAADEAAADVVVPPDAGPKENEGIVDLAPGGWLNENPAENPPDVAAPEAAEVPAAVMLPKSGREGDLGSAPEEAGLKENDGLEAGWEAASGVAAKDAVEDPPKEGAVDAPRAPKVGVVDGAPRGLADVPDPRPPKEELDDVALGDVPKELKRGGAGTGAAAVSGVGGLEAL